MVPGFHAEAALYEERTQYRSAGVWGQSDNQFGTAPSVAPAFGIDCYPMCVIFAEARCRRMCPPHSIDCLPTCIIMAENRCRRLCGVGRVVPPGLVAGPVHVGPGDPVEEEIAGELMD